MYCIWWWRRTTHSLCFSNTFHTSDSSTIFLGNRDNASAITHRLEEVNRVQLERATISVSMIRGATQTDPFCLAWCISCCVVYFLLYGGPEEGTLPEELRFFFTKQDEFTIEEGCLLRGTRVVIPTRYQGQVLAELHFNHPWEWCEWSLQHVYMCGGLHWIKILNRLSEIAPVVKLTAANPLWKWEIRGYGRYVRWQRIHIDFAGPVDGVI